MAKSNIPNGPYERSVSQWAKAEAKREFRRIIEKRFGTVRDFAAFRGLLDMATLAARRKYNRGTFGCSDTEGEIDRNREILESWIRQRESYYVKVFSGSDPEMRGLADSLHRNLLEVASYPRRRNGKQATVNPALEKVKSQIRDLKNASLSQQEICRRLGDAPRPENAAWNGLPWPKAYLHYNSSVKSWLSRIK